MTSSGSGLWCESDAEKPLEMITIRKAHVVFVFVVCGDSKGEVKAILSCQISDLGASQFDEGRVKNELLLS
jgi:hypothetical protein